jgi:hypothetical protein
MPFSFLNPWFLAAALAVGVPLWLHLRRKQEEKIVPFSAVRFLQDQPRPRRSPLHLENLFLFLLRAAALVLLAAAFAWPYLRPKTMMGVAETRVFILDNTLSQQADGKFEAGRARILREIRRAPASIQVGVVELTSAPRVVAGFGDSRDAAAQKLTELTPSHQRGSYLAAFRLAATLLEKTPVPRKRVILVGDNQANQWTEATNALPFLRDTHVEVVRSDTRTLPNAYLSAPNARRVFKGDKSLVSLTVHLSHCGELPRAKVFVKANGQIVLSRDVDLSEQPGTQTIQAEWEAPPETPVQGQATVEAAPDSLTADNHVFFEVPSLVEGRVALLAHSPYLRLALSPEVMRGRWLVDGANSSDRENGVGQRTEADVLCLESSYFASPEARSLVGKYLNDGRGVLLFVDRLSPAIKAHLQELGFEADRQKENSNEESIQFVVPNHPVFQRFVSGEYGGLLDLKFSNYSRLKSQDATPLLFSKSGAGLLFEAKRGAGRLYLAAFGMDREHTSWPVHPTFVPFLDLVLQSCRGGEGERPFFETGEFASIAAARGTEEGQGAILKSGSTVLAQSQVSGGRIRFRLPDNPGLYTVDIGALQAETTVAVNCPAKESDLVYTQSAVVPPAWQIKRERPPTSLASLSLPARSEVFAQRLWWWLLLGALAALLIEAHAASRRRLTT